MMRWLAVLLLLSVFPASAQPPCIPGIYGTTLDVNAPRRSDTGWRLVWLCDKAGTPTASTLVCVHGTCVEQVLRDTYINATQAADPAATIKAAWTAQVKVDCATATGGTKTVCDEAAADAIRLIAAYRARQTPVVWVVAPNGSYLTRPTYAWTNGVRATTAAAERVSVGTACDPAVGAGTYRGVLGRSDRVAVCAQK